MKTLFADRVQGLARQEQALSVVMAGASPILMTTSASSRTLTTSSRELVRSLRKVGIRTEFYVPGEAGALLQAVNRLLADIPLESFGKTAEVEPPRLLIIDDAEGLSLNEAAALKRIVNGLRGSALRVLLLVKTSASQIVLLPLADIAELAVLWDLDATNDDATNDEEPTLAPTTDTSESLHTPLSIDPSTISPVADLPIPDVLTELARERAAALGIDAKSRSASTVSIIKATLMAMAALLAGFFIYEMMAEQRNAPSRTFDCGLHPDREAVDVLLARVPRATPTRILSEDGRLRLLIGPFPDAAAAGVVQAQLWRVGSCRPKPVVIPMAISNSEKKLGG